MDITEFITARLDAEEQAAYELSGTTWEARHLGDHDYEIRVTHDKLIHATAPTKAIADVQRQDVAEWIAAHDPRRAQRDIEAKRAILKLHNRVHDCPIVIPVSNPESFPDGCYISTEHIEETSEPCTTLRQLAATWARHPDYQQEWKP